MNLVLFMPQFSQNDSMPVATRLARGQDVANVTLGGVMWQTLRKQTYRLLYFLGKQPPSSAEIALELDRLERSTPQPESTAGGERCDCFVSAGNTTIDCFPNILKHACELIGDTQPGVTSTPLPLGSCKNIPKGQS
jgi:hypothetical protein